jgi:heme oxygenase
MSLAEALKTQTRALHTALERGSLMRSLLRGEMPRTPYCALLRNLHVLYAALEPALLRHAAHPGVAPVVFPALFRSQALADDLSELHGAAWRQEIATALAGRRYAQHLHDIAAHRPALLVAHAYVRYLGDLSGGQMLRRIVAAGFSLEDGRGTRFYDFGAPGAVAEQVRAFRAGLAQLDHGDEQVAGIVAEAVGSFQRHQELFDELAGVPRSPEAAAVNPAS